MCEYCKATESIKINVNQSPFKTNILNCEVITHEDNTAVLTIMDKSLGMAYIDINYCPICGRRLTQ